MRWIKAGAFAPEIDLSVIDQQLHQQQVIHRFTKEANVQVLWLPEDLDAAAVMAQIQYWMEHPETIADSAKPNTSAVPALRFSERPAPVTLILVALCFVGAALYYLGDNVIRPLTFWDQFDQLRAADTVFRDIAKGELWRLITPIFLHFTPMHSIFNALSLWYLGSIVERESGIWRLLSVVFLTGLISNTGQALVSTDFILFGGMSGVVFGLLSYIWLAEKIDPACGYRLMNSLFIFMTVYMLLSTFGIFDWLAGGGGIADTAHIVGYLSGLCLAVVYHLFKSHG